MSFSLRVVLLLFVLLLVVSSPVLAQSELGTATLNGTVADPSGAAIAGAKVTATNTATGFVRTVQTTEAGIYTLLRLPVGSYDLTVEAQGFKTFKRGGVNLGIGAVLTLDTALEVGSASESVTVTTEVPVIETTRSQTSTVVNDRAVRDLPINNRNFLDFATLTPGVVRDPRDGDLSFGGLRGTSNSLLIDGGESNNLFFGQSSGRAGVRNPYTFSQESVQEFQVNTNGYAAEVGRAAGGVINVITKSGTNELHGNAFWFYRGTNLNANRSSNKFSPSARFPQGIPRQRYEFDQFGANVGGPVQKDKVFFFFNYEGQRNDDPVSFFLPTPPADAASQRAAEELARYTTPYSRGLNNDILLFKADWNISANQNMNVRYNRARFTGKNYENTAQTAENGTGNSENNTDNIAVTYNRVMGGNKILDLRYIFLKDDAPGTANSEGPRTQVNQSGQTYIAFGRNNFSPRYTNIKKNQVAGSLSVVKGRHTMKFGGDLNFERIENFFPGQFGGTYTFNSLADFANRRPADFTQAFAGANTSGPLTRPNINEYGFFAQDQFRVNDKLTLNYGVRYDLFDYAAGTVRNPDPQLVAARLFNDRINLDRNNIALRFGVAYKLTDRLVMRAGLGNFYGRIAAIVTGTSHNNNGIQIQQFTIFPGNPAFPTYPNLLPSVPPGALLPANIYVMDPDVRSPQSYQWSYNLEYQASKDIAVTIGYLGVRGIGLGRTRDINQFPYLSLTGTEVDLAGNRSPITFLRRPATRPNAAFGRIAIHESGAGSIYHGGFVQVTKRYSQRFQLLGSYTWSKVVDSGPTPVAVVPFTGDDAVVPFDSLNPNLERAAGDSDVTHRLVASGTWDINYANRLQNPVMRYLFGDYQLSVITAVSSGRPFSQRIGQDYNNDGNNRNDRPPFIGRNTLRLPTFGTLDFRFSKGIPLYKERVRGQLIFEAFNVMNRTNITGVQSNFYNFAAATSTFTRTPNYLFASATGDPRILQLAAKITF